MSEVITLKIPAGISRNGTRYQSKGRYYDAHLVRFYENTKRPIGGWQVLNESVPDTVVGEADFSTIEDFNDYTADLLFGNGSSHASDPNSWATIGGALIHVGNIAGSNVVHFLGDTGYHDNFILRVEGMKHSAVGAINAEMGVLIRANSGATEYVKVHLTRTASHTFDAYVGGVLLTSGLTITALDDGTGIDFVVTVAGSSITLSWEPNGGGTSTEIGVATLGTYNDASHEYFGFWGSTSHSGQTLEWGPLTLTRPAYTQNVAVTGTARKLLAWKNDGIVGNLAIGTNSNIYVFSAGGLTDLTPGDLTAGNVDTETAVGEYGAGAYGSGNYGEGDLAQAVQVEAASWQLDTFGEYLVGVLTSDGRLLYWDGAAGTMVESDSAPESNKAVVTTAERFVVLLGADGDPRKVRWPDRETIDSALSLYDIWDLTNEDIEAGEFLLPGTGDLLCGKRGANETLLFTSDDVWAMRYVGGVLIYSFTQLGTKCGAASRHAVGMVDGKAFWMDLRGFFKYDGAVHPLPLDVTDYVFSDFNKTQAAKIFAVTNSAFGEITWFYPSADSDEPNRYVTYNYIENHATIGQLTRTAGIDRDGVFEYPTLAKVSNVYQHERGTAHEDEDATVPAPYLETGPIELGEGKYVMDILGVIPDESQNGAQEVGALAMTIYTAYRPDGAETEHGPYTMAERTDVRLNARTVRVRHEEIEEGDWRLGDVRLEVAQGGER